MLPHSTQSVTGGSPPTIKKREGKGEWLRVGPRLCVFIVRAAARHTLMQNLIRTTLFSPFFLPISFWHTSEAP